MADKYYYSAAAGAGTGADFANAYTTIAAAIAGMAAGDTLYVAHDTANELIGSAQTYPFPGTMASPNKILCVTRADPPTTLNTMTNAIGSSGAFSTSVSGCFYAYGVTFVAGSGTATAVALRLGTTVNSNQVYDTCQLKMLSTSNSTSCTIGIGAGNNTVQNSIRLINTTLTFSAVSQKLLMAGGDLYWTDTATPIAGTYPTTTLIVDGGSTRAGTVTFDGVDLSGFAAATKITPAFSMCVQTFMSNCKMATGVNTAGEIFTAPSGLGSANYAINCSDGAGPILTMASLAQGTLDTTTSIYRSGGASDGTTPYGWTVTSTSAASRINPFQSVEIARFSTSTSAMTATVEIATDNVTLTNNECWIEVHYPNSGTVPSVAVVTTACGLMATPANIATSSVTWTGVPGTPVKQKITTGSFTPAAAGDVRVILCYAKASGTVYVDPVVTLT